MAIWNRKSLVASAYVVTPRDPSSLKKAAAGYRPWQDTAWELYDKLAEIHYPANFTGSSLSRFTLHIGVIPEGTTGMQPRLPLQTERSDLVRAAEDALEALGDHAEILRRYGINKTVAADGWLYGEDKANDTTWEFLSVSEIHADGVGKIVRFPSGSTSDTMDLPPDGFTLIRFFQAHPRFTNLADGPLQSLQDDCKRLLALNDSITSRLLSRMSQAGILFIPNTLSVAGETTQPDGTNESNDPFYRRLLHVMEQSMLRPGTGAGSIPIMVRGASGEGDKIVHITLDREIDRVEMELRAELRGTIATGMDLPPEVQQGMGSSTHWQSWGIMDSVYTSHLVPAASDFAVALTRSYLWTAVRQLLGRDLTMDERRELRRIWVFADGSNVISRPNQAKDGFDMSDRAIISDAATRSRGGATEEEAPDGDEYVRILGRKMSDPYLALWGLPEAEQIDWSKVSTRGPGAPGASGQGGEPPSKYPADPGNPVGGPGTGDAGKTQRGENLTARAERVAAAARFAVPAADGIVGAKLRSFATRPGMEALSAKLKPLSNAQVTEVLEAEDLDLMGVTVDDRVKMYLAALDPFLRQVTEWESPRIAYAYTTLLAAERGQGFDIQSQAEELALDVLSFITS